MKDQATRTPDIPYLPIIAITNLLAAESDLSDHINHFLAIVGIIILLKPYTKINKNHFSQV